jgi:hypothetical protein
MCRKETDFVNSLASLETKDPNMPGIVEDPATQQEHFGTTPVHRVSHCRGSIIPQLQNIGPYPDPEIF